MQSLFFAQIITDLKAAFGIQWDFLVTSPWISFFSIIIRRMNERAFGSRQRGSHVCEKKKQSYMLLRRPCPSFSDSNSKGFCCAYHLKSLVSVLPGLSSCSWVRSTVFVVCFCNLLNSFNSFHQLVMHCTINKSDARYVLTYQIRPTIFHIKIPITKSCSIDLHPKLFFSFITFLPSEPWFIKQNPTHTRASRYIIFPRRINLNPHISTPNPVLS